MPKAEKRGNEQEAVAHQLKTKAARLAARGEHQAAHETLMSAIRLMKRACVDYEWAMYGYRQSVAGRRSADRGLTGFHRSRQRPRERRPAASRRRSSARSGDSGDDGPGSEPPAALPEYAVGALSWRLCGCDRPLAYTWTGPHGLSGLACLRCGHELTEAVTT